MVMAVATLPGYPLVFKVIRDRFAYPKNIAPEQVREKYLLVFKHDRVGRLIDAQEYRFLRFPRAQFEARMLEELLGECAASVSLEGEDVVVHHCYVERRLRPLNLYVKEVDEATALGYAEADPTADVEGFDAAAKAAILAGLAFHTRVTAADVHREGVTEVTAGSGLYGPTLFDAYRAWRPTPAALFGLPVVRRPAPGMATVLGGGYLASGAAGGDRLPRPVLPAGLRLDRQEGAGEVQTPVAGEAARSLRVGDRVWFRHAKAGELCERFDAVHLLRGGELVETVPTYRGEGRTFL